MPSAGDRFYFLDPTLGAPVLYVNVGVYLLGRFLVKEKKTDLFGKSTCRFFGGGAKTKRLMGGGSLPDFLTLGGGV